jgi:acetylornithine deacetylase/succinyl-diaminopimelate desuccinylase-like protein
MSASEAAERELLRRLVAAGSPNPPGDERAVAAVVAEIAESLGLPPAVVHARAPHRPNLVYRLGEGSPRLIIVAHMDTVPAAAGWETDPLLLCEGGDGRLVGLGAADMKAAIVVMLVVAGRLMVDRLPVTMIFSADEEAGSGFGMAWLAQQGLLEGDAAIMMEPSSTGEGSWDRLYVAQRGSCVCLLEAEGVPGHSGLPMPIEQRATAPFARALAILTEADPFPDIAHPVDGTRPFVNVATTVAGGDIPFAYPDRLCATIEVRTIEGMTADLVLEQLRAVVADADLETRVTISSEDSEQTWIPPGATVRDERLLGAVGSAWEMVLGHQPRLGVFPAGTDSSHANARGIPALPAFGPGSLGVAHRPGESVAAADLGVAMDLLEHTVRTYCDGPHG